VDNKEFKRKRMSLGLNQTELARLLDIKPNTVSRYETGVLSVPKVVELALEGIESKINEPRMEKAA
jgi:transcriptional regulator with XRE-family HTH domain